MVNIKHILDEKTRREILNKEKETQARITRSQQYSVSNVVIDPDAFMNNWCVIKGIVHRPGHAYETVIAFQNVFTDLVQVAKQTSGHGVNAHLIQKSLKQSLDRNDIYLDCQCPDFKYRYAYHSTQGKFKWGKLQYSNGKKIRNPNNDIGSTCKHLYALLISNRFMNYVSDKIMRILMANLDILYKRFNFSLSEFIVNSQAYDRLLTMNVTRDRSGRFAKKTQPALDTPSNGSQVNGDSDNEQRN